MHADPLPALDDLASALSASALVLLASFLAILAWKGREAMDRCVLAFSGVVALVLGASWGLRVLGYHAAGLRLLAVIGGLAAVLMLLARLPAWLRVVAAAEGAGALVQAREQALDRLKATETDLGALLGEARDFAIFWLDLRGRVVSWNDGAARIKGWRAEEILARPHDVFYPAEEAAAGLPAQDLAQANTSESVIREAWRMRKDGSRFIARVTLAAQRDGQGRVTGYTRITHDLTEHREAEARLKSLARDLETQMATRTAELQESEARLQGFIRHASAAFAFKGLDGRLLLANRRAEALAGLSEAVTPEAATQARKDDERVIASREELQTEETVTFSDGCERTLLIQKFPLLDGVGRCWGVGVIGTDITERKLAEQAHLQHQKLESIGLLAGGIAHDFNNLLGAMSGHMELARLETAPDAAVLAHLSTLEELIARAASLVAQILAYAGKGKFQVQTLDLNAEVEGMLRLLGATLSRNATIRWVPAPGLPGLEGDMAQIQQVIMNLVLNASDAVAGQGGTITLRTHLEHLTREVIDRHYPGQPLKPGPHLVLEVADDGPGMSPQVKERIFDPFYTTKFTGRGLGLSAVQGILRSHGGGVRVLTEAGRGTTFRLLFPALISAKPAPFLEPVGLGAYHGTGTVLLVEDEDALRAVAKALLIRLGFEVLEGRDGLEALQAFHAHRAQIRLILMDLTMPRMDGKEAYRELRRAGARAPILLCSGFGAEEALQGFRGQGLAGFVQKPYRFNVLLDAVRRALGEADGEGVRRSSQPVAWVPEFETGHRGIDARHRELVDRYNRLVSAHAEGKAAALEALGSLVDATVDHFSYEEGLMSKVDYDQAADHRAIHAHLTGQVRELAEELRSGKAELSQDLMDYLEGWLFCHIQFEDRHLAQHL